MADRFDNASGADRRPRGDEVPVDPDLLRVAVRELRSGVLVVAPAGEVDMSTSALLRDAAFGAVDAAPRHVVVDLSRLTFCGSTGLVVLIDTRSHADAADVGFGTAAATPIVRRMIEITGTQALLRYRESVDEVLRVLSTRS
jgi:anti-sigma B factor antagonist